MSGQQICLKWNSFQSNIVTSFENLWEEEGLVDVTLASDGQCIRAHKVILSACSPFFRRVFQVLFEVLLCCSDSMHISSHILCLGLCYAHFW
jgi:BTB/POZ domain.